MTSNVGAERVIRFTDGGPSWPGIVEKLVAMGEQPVVRMIDGLPAFPDETPDAAWRELRVSLRGGMVTLRRDGDEIRCVVWGDADAALGASWDACCRAIGEAGGERSD